MERREILARWFYGHNIECRNYIFLARNKPKILAAGYQGQTQKVLITTLRGAGYDVTTASTGVETLEEIRTKIPDMVILEVVLPDMDGFEMLKELRTFSSVPVIILSIKNTDIDKIKGLGLGADDYVGKPFNPDELVERIRAVMRRIDPLNGLIREKYVFGGLSIDFARHILRVNSCQVSLMPTEWMLLGELVQNAGCPIPYEVLSRRALGIKHEDNLILLRCLISRLRNKITAVKENGPTIKTVREVGYYLSVENKDMVPTVEFGFLPKDTKNFWLEKADEFLAVG